MVAFVLVCRRPLVARRGETPWESARVGRSPCGIHNSFASVYVELFVFVAGMVAYFTSFGTTLPKATQSERSVGQACEQ